MLLDNVNQNALLLGLLVAFVVPLVRCYLRWKKDIKPFFQREILRHDLMNGFSLPFFFLILISPFFDSIKIDDSTLMVTAGYAITLVIMDTIDNGRSPCMRTRSTDINQNKDYKT